MKKNSFNNTRLVIIICIIFLFSLTYCDAPSEKDKLDNKTNVDQGENGDNQINKETTLLSRIKTIENWYDDAYDSLKPGGFGVVIIKDGEVLLKRTFGYANEEHKVPFEFNTVFNFASIAKQFTGFAMARLIQNGKVSINDDIRKYLPEIPEFNHQIKIKHLLNHTSGLRDLIPLLKLSGRLKNDVMTGDHIMKLIINQEELNFIPGEKHSYCNTGYFLLARIVSKVTQKPFDEWVKENIFEQIEMEASLIHDDYDKIIPNRSSSYILGKENEYYRFTSNLTAIGSGELLSTMDDMIKWLLNMDTKTLGGENLFDLMTSPSNLNNGKIINYNFGLQKDEQHGNELLSHGGSWGGYVSELKYFPKEHLSLLFFANRSPSGVYLSHNALDLILGVEQKPSTELYANSNRSFVDIDLKKFDNYLGSYALKLKEPDGNRIYYLSRVFIKDNRLVATSPMYNNNRLFPISEKKFFIKGDTNEYEFFTDENGKCFQYTITHDENNYTFIRMEKKVKDFNGIQELLGEYYSRELNTSYNLVIKDGELTFTHPINEDAHIYKVGDGRDGYAGDSWWFNDVIFTRNKYNKVNGVSIQTTGGNLSTNIKFEKVFTN